MSEEKYHLLIEKGPGKGSKIYIPIEGARLGRSSKNEICLADPALSRHHARFSFKSGKLYVTDLGSANQTILNGKPIFEEELHPGDLLLLGDTLIRVLSSEPIPEVPSSGLVLRPVEDVIADEMSVTQNIGKLRIDEKAECAIQQSLCEPPQEITERDKSSTTPLIDLGLGKEREEEPKKIGLWPLVVVAFLITAIAVGVWIPKIFKKDLRNKEKLGGISREGSEYPEIYYEKVDADTNNIFRYYLSIVADGTLRVEIDDIKNNRHIYREKKLNEECLRGLSQIVKESGFFTLMPDYAGALLPGIYSLRDMEVVTAHRVHRVKVLNRPEPDIFKNIREKLEIFARNELGLIALEFSADQLIKMAEDSYLEAKKLYDERELKYGNLYNAIANLKKVEMNLETIENKPPFYAEALRLIKDYQKELNRKYDEYRFAADQAIRLEEWIKAKDILIIICELIPDRNDERHARARKELLEVQARLERTR